MPTERAELVVDCRSLLGEGVTWDAATQTLLWLDIDGKKLHSLAQDGNHAVTDLENKTSVVVPSRNGAMVSVAGLSIGLLESSGRQISELTVLPADGDGLANDGRCDPTGCLWVGTVDRSGLNRGGLFRVSHSGEITRMRHGMALSNGIDWSPDGSRCYHADSMSRRIDVLTLRPDGTPERIDLFVELELMPDGLSVDEDGGVWVALWDGGVVQRFAPDGRLDRTISLPGGWITSCAFGGADLRTLYITTARVDLDPRTQILNPHAGSLFALDVGVAGRGYTRFGDTRAM